MSSGKIDLLIAGPGTDPSMIELCRSLNIPLISTEDPKKARRNCPPGKGENWCRIEATFYP